MGARALFALLGADVTANVTAPSKFGVCDFGAVLPPHMATNQCLYSSRCLNGLWIEDRELEKDGLASRVYGAVRGFFAHALARRGPGPRAPPSLSHPRPRPLPTPRIPRRTWTMWTPLSA